MSGWWKALIGAFSRRPAEMSVQADDVAVANHADEADDAFWQAVYDARAAYYAHEFGALPDDILKLGHLFGVWPGGGLFVIPSTRIAADSWVFTTFGLSNPDMPTSTTVSDVDVEKDAQGRVVRNSATLKAKAEAPDRREGLAGYGYELMVVARENAEWPLWILQWAVNAELLNDVGFLDRVDQYDGLTIEDVRVGEDDHVDLLIARARPPLPVGSDLPNGGMALLVATAVTRAEMQWSMQHGRAALLDRLLAAGVGQTSVRDRASVVE